MLSNLQAIGTAVLPFDIDTLIGCGFPSLEEAYDLTVAAPSNEAQAFRTEYRASYKSRLFHFALFLDLAVLLANRREADRPPLSGTFIVDDWHAYRQLRHNCKLRLFVPDTNLTDVDRRILAEFGILIMDSRFARRYTSSRTLLFAPSQQPPVPANLRRERYPAAMFTDHHARMRQRGQSQDLRLFDGYHQIPFVDVGQRR